MHLLNEWTFLIASSPALLFHLYRQLSAVFTVLIKTFTSIKDAIPQFIPYMTPNPDAMQKNKSLHFNMNQVELIFQFDLLTLHILMMMMIQTYQIKIKIISTAFSFDIWNSAINKKTHITLTLMHCWKFKWIVTEF